MGSRLRCLVLPATVALLASACTGGDGDEGRVGARGKIQVTVHFQGALTGDFDYLVTHAYQAARLRFDELNGDEGFPAVVTLEQADTQGDRGRAPAVAQGVVDDPNTVAVIGPAFAGESEESGGIYNEARIPFVTPSATTPELADRGWDYWYRTVANDDDQGGPLGEWIASRYSGIYVAHDQSSYGQGLAEVVADVAQQSGASVEKVEGIVPTEVYSTLIGDVEASGAEALFYGGYDIQTGQIVAQARDAGLDLPIYSGDGSVSTILLDLAGDTGTDVFLSCPCNLEGEGDFLSTYEAEYGETRVPIFAAEGYDAASLVGEGIRSAIEGGAETPTAIREGIKTYLDSLTVDAPFSGVAKQIAFDDAGELAAQDRRALIFFYSVEPGQISLEGSASEVLG